ncbi:MAG TPA: prepilin-type N-terminal cleavage/methylation domain-containing protein [Blastocatellia bacterium]|nr:prepilin-type N-terminal cleavage/methylation domain-containing protein [Blastocatellia bacterium]
MRDEVGYSLVELLSVTAVLAIVMAIAVPNLSRAQRHYQLQAAAGISIGQQLFLPLLRDWV